MSNYQETIGDIENQTVKKAIEKQAEGVLMHKPNEYAFIHYPNDPSTVKNEDGRKLVTPRGEINKMQILAYLRERLMSNFEQITGKPPKFGVTAPCALEGLSAYTTLIEAKRNLVLNLTVLKNSKLIAVASVRVQPCYTGVLIGYGEYINHGYNLNSGRSDNEPKSTINRLNLKAFIELVNMDVFKTHYGFEPEYDKVLLSEEVAKLNAKHKLYRKDHAADLAGILYAIISKPILDEFIAKESATLKSGVVAAAQELTTNITTHIHKTLKI